MNAARGLEADEVRRALNAMGVAGLLGALGLLEGAKRQARGCLVRCPHHNERDPSCSVQERGGRIVANCFACGWGGGALDLVAEVRGVDGRARFPQLLDEAAAIAGVVPNEAPKASEPRRREPPKPRPAPEPEPPALADEVFHELVHTLCRVSPVDAVPDVRAYVERRGLLDEAREAGWGALPSPDEQWRVLAEPLELAGRILVDDGAEYDKAWAAGLESFRLSGLAMLDKRAALVVDDRGLPRFAYSSHRIVIPHRRPDGRIYTVKRRDLLADDERGRAPKYVAATRRPIRWPYGVELVAHAEPDAPVMFVEGEADALDRRAALRRGGVSRIVLAVPGVSSWRPEWAEYARGRAAYVALDDDEAGQGKAAEVERDLYAAGAARVKRAKPTRGKDWNQGSEAQP